VQIFTRSGRTLSVPTETLHFLIIAIQKTESVSYTCIRAFVYYSRLCVASITPINTLTAFRGSTS